MVVLIFRNFNKYVNRVEDAELYESSLNLKAMT